MRKSLFTKLMTVFFIIIVISYSIVAVFLSAWFYKYYYNQRAEAMLREEQNLDTLALNYIDERTTTNSEKLQYQLSVVDRLINARILVVDNFGFFIGYSGSGLENMTGKQITSSEIEEVRNGNTVVKTGGLKKVFTSPMLMVGVPVKEDSQVKGAVFMYAPLDEIKSALSRVFTVIWLSAFVAIFISVFIVYYISQKILVKPLGKINQIAKSISKGEFDKRVNINSNDEIGELALSFNYMADSLQNLENMRKNFIANISHELRSPITSINGFITGMLDGTIPDEKRSYYLGIVNNEIKRLIRLINDLLDLARLESGEFSLQMGVFDLNELIRERIIKFEDKINKKNINVNVVLPGDKLMVKGDRDRIDQVLTNLIDNAIKFVNESGNIEVKVEIKDNKALTSVFNNGPAIPKDEIKYIWDRFHKVDKARSKGGGTGLGLSIARQIINQHNQTIWVESGEFGTKFTFTMNIA